MYEPLGPIENDFFYSLKKNPFQIVGAEEEVAGDGVKHTNLASLTIMETRDFMEFSPEILQKKC